MEKNPLVLNDKTWLSSFEKWDGGCMSLPKISSVENIV